MGAESLSEAELLFSLDTPELIPINLRESYLKGWFVPPKTVRVSSLAVVVDGDEKPVYTGFSRPDVSRHFTSQAAGKSGFVAVIPTPQPGQQVSLVAQIDSETRELVGNIQVKPQKNLSGTGLSGGPVSSYRDWVFTYESTLLDPLKSISYQPKISLLAEFQECSVYFLSRFLQSLSAQLYPNWQLCVAGEYDQGADLFRFLRSIAAIDARVSILPSSPRTDDSGAWNATLLAAEGEFVGQVRLWDELHPSALLEMAASLQNSETDIVYSDEDEIDLFGQRSRPTFKPDFDSERVLAYNYMGNLTIVRHRLAMNSGGFRSFPQGAQEWDFLLRSLEQTGPDKVTHLAKPLYHRRGREALAEAGLDISFTRSDDLCQVVRDHATRTGKHATAQVGFPTDTIRLHYRVPKNVSVSIFLRDDDGVFQSAALTGLANQYRVEFYGILNHIVHRLPDPFAESFSIYCYEHGINSQIRPPVVDFDEISGDVLVFINRPIDLLSHFFLHELIAQALREDCGLVTGLSVDSSGQFIHTGFIRQDGDKRIDPFAGTSSRIKSLGKYVRVTRSVEAIADQFFAVRREHVEAIGGFSQLSSSRMPEFVNALSERAHQLRLRILVTPYSIATFDRVSRPISTSETGQSLHSTAASLNPNLRAFSDPYLPLEL